jgi:DNA invertase Pin-like site-specific DNA recombinase
MKKAFSYLRFSSAEQRKGDSYRRQTEKAKSYAEAHGLLLDEHLTFQDLGTSAYRGKHKEVGKLGEFLGAIEEGLVNEGDYLLIENLDRLSREKVTDAYNLLSDICKRGVNVVTFSDGKVYTQESLGDIITLLSAILIFSRSHEESLIKGQRVGAAWKNKRENAKDKPLTAKVPGWITFDRDAGELRLIPERAEVVMEIFSMYLEGKGHAGIAGELNKRDVATWGVGKQRGNQWHRSYIAKILENEATIGVFTPHKLDYINGKNTRVPCTPVRGYYPNAVDEEIFQRAQELRRSKNGIKGRKATRKLQNIFSNVAVCSTCGSKTLRISKGGNWEYLVCGAVKWGTKTVDGSKLCAASYSEFKYREIEQTFVQAVRAGEFVIPADGDSITVLRGEIEEAEQHKNSIQDELGKLATAIASGDITNSTVMHYKVPRADGSVSDWTVGDQREFLETSRTECIKQIHSLKNKIEMLRPSVLDKKMKLLKDAVSGESINAEQVNASLRSLCREVVIGKEEMVFRFNHCDKEMVLPREAKR